MATRRKPKKSPRRGGGRTGNEGLNLKKAIKRPGRMTEWCKRHGYGSATCSCLKKAKQVAQQKKDRSLLSAANLGMRLKGCGGMKLDKRGRKRKR